MASHNLTIGRSAALRIPMPRTLAAALSLARSLEVLAGLSLLRGSGKRRPADIRHPLRDLPVHLLRDMGLERSDIAYAASFGHLPIRYRGRLRIDRPR